jgi:hypothetical protein
VTEASAFCVTITRLPAIRNPLGEGAQFGFPRRAGSGTEAVATDASFIPGGTNTAFGPAWMSRKESGGCAQALASIAIGASSAPRRDMRKN